MTSYHLHISSLSILHVHEDKGREVDGFFVIFRGRLTREQEELRQAHERETLLDTGNVGNFQESDPDLLASSRSSDERRGSRRLSDTLKQPEPPLTEHRYSIRPVRLEHCDPCLLA